MSHHVFGFSRSTAGLFLHSSENKNSLPEVDTSSFSRRYLCGIFWRVAFSDAVVPHFSPCPEVDASSRSNSISGAFRDRSFVGVRIRGESGGRKSELIRRKH